MVLRGISSHQGSNLAEYQFSLTVLLERMRIRTYAFSVQLDQSFLCKFCVVRVLQLKLGYQLSVCLSFEQLLVQMPLFGELDTISGIGSSVVQMGRDMRAWPCTEHSRGFDWQR